MNLKWITAFFITLLLCILTACSSTDSSENSAKSAASEQPDPSDGYVLKPDVDNINDHLDYTNSHMKKIYFAGGCFWGVEAYMERIYGVNDVTSGYANGNGEDPTYEAVIQGNEGFAETVEVTYDPERVSLEKLLQDLFAVIDPTSKDKQGNDVGVQYRTGVYYEDDKDKEVIETAVKKEQESYDAEIVTEVLPLKNYYLAEEVHQDYLDKNPNGYCHIDLHVLDNMSVDPIAKDEDVVEKFSE